MLRYALIAAAAVGVAKSDVVGWFDGQALRRFVDRDNGVVCYSLYNTASLSCLLLAPARTTERAPASGDAR